MPICDICGDQLGESEAKVIRPDSVVKATSKGYVPSRLPSSWKPQCEMLGVAVGAHWSTVVNMNAGVDWGMCGRCLDEINAFNAASNKAPTASQSSQTKTRQLYHLLFVWSHPQSHDQQSLGRLLHAAIPEYRAQSTHRDGKVGMVWITEPVDGYDLIGTAAGAFGNEIKDPSKYELEERTHASGPGKGRILMVWMKVTQAAARTATVSSAASSLPPNVTIKYKNPDKKWWQFWR